MAAKLKKLGYATLYRRGSFMDRRGIVYGHKKTAVKQSDMYVYSIKLVVPVYVKASELKKATKAAKDKRRARHDKFNKLCADAQKEE